MPRLEIELQNGLTQQVDFDTMPSDDDIDHVAKHLSSIQPQIGGGANATGTFKNNYNTFNAVKDSLYEPNDIGLQVQNPILPQQQIQQPIQQVQQPKQIVRQKPQQLSNYNPLNINAINQQNNNSIANNSFALTQPNMPSANEVEPTVDLQNRLIQAGIQKNDTGRPWNDFWYWLKTKANAVGDKFLRYLVNPKYAKYDEITPENQAELDIAGSRDDYKRLQDIRRGKYQTDAPAANIDELVSLYKNGVIDANQFNKSLSTVKSNIDKYNAQVEKNDLARFENNRILDENLQRTSKNFETGTNATDAALWGMLAADLATGGALTVPMVGGAIAKKVFSNVGKKALLDQTQRIISKEAINNILASQLLRASGQGALGGAIDMGLLSGAEGAAANYLDLSDQNPLINAGQGAVAGGVGGAVLAPLLPMAVGATKYAGKKVLPRLNPKNYTFEEAYEPVRKDGIGLSGIDEVWQSKKRFRYEPERNVKTPKPEETYDGYESDYIYDNPDNVVNNNPKYIENKSKHSDQPSDMQYPSTDVVNNPNFELKQGSDLSYKSPLPPQEPISHAEEQTGQIIPEQEETSQNESPIVPKTQPTRQQAEENARRNGEVDTTLPMQNIGKVARRREKDGTISVSRNDEPWFKYKKRVTSGKAEGADTLQRNTSGEEHIYDNVDKSFNQPDTLLNPKTYNNKLINKLKQRYTTLEDPETNRYILVNKKTGKQVSYDDILKLRERLRDTYNLSLRNSEIDKDVDKFMKSVFSDADIYEDTSNDITDVMSPSQQIQEDLWTIKEPEYASRYTSDMSPDFQEWYEEYSKSSSDRKKKMLSEKINSFDTLNEAEDFVSQFSNIEYLDNIHSSKNVKIGDNNVDIDDVSETEKLTNALNENKEHIDSLNKVNQTDEGYTNKNAIRWANDTWDSILGGSSHKNTKWSKLNLPNSNTKWHADNSYDVINGISSWFRGATGANKDAQKGIQRIYDKAVSRIKSDYNIPSSVKEVMFNQLDEALDHYLTNDWTKKPWNEGKELPTIKKYDGVRDANSLRQKQEAKFINLINNGRYDIAGRVMVENHINYKYASPEAQKCIDKYFENRLDSMNKILFIDKNGNPNFKKILSSAVKNHEKGSIRFFNRTKNSIRRPQNINALTKEDKIKILDDAFERYKNVLDKNKRIIATDIKKNAYNSGQMRDKKQYNKSNNKYEQIGDTWSRDFSGVLDNNDIERLIDNQIAKYQKIVDDYKNSISKVKTNMDLDKIANNYFNDAYDKAGRPNLNSEKIAEWATEGLNPKHGLHPDLISNFDKAFLSAKKNFAKEYQKMFLSNEKNENVVELENRLKELQDEDGSVMYNYSNDIPSNSSKPSRFSIHKLLSHINAKKISKLKNINPVFNYLSNHFKGIDDYIVITDNQMFARGSHTSKHININLEAIGDNEETFVYVVAHELQHAMQEARYNELKNKTNLTDEEKQFINDYNDCKNANNELRKATQGNEKLLNKIYSDIKNLDIDARMDYLRDFSYKDWNIYLRHYNARQHYLNTPLEKESRDVGERLSRKYSTHRGIITKNGGTRNTMGKRWLNGIYKPISWHNIWSRGQQQRLDDGSFFDDDLDHKNLTQQEITKLHDDIDNAVIDRNNFINRTEVENNLNIADFNNAIRDKKNVGNLKPEIVRKLIPFIREGKGFPKKMPELKDAWNELKPYQQKKLYDLSQELYEGMSAPWKTYSEWNKVQSSVKDEVYVPHSYKGVTEADQALLDKYYNNQYDPTNLKTYSKHEKHRLNDSLADVIDNGLKVKVQVGTTSDVKPKYKTETIQVNPELDYVKLMQKHSEDLSTAVANDKFINKFNTAKLSDGTKVVDTDVYKKAYSRITEPDPEKTKFGEFYDEVLNNPSKAINFYGSLFHYKALMESAVSVSGKGAINAFKGDYRLSKNKDLAIEAAGNGVQFGALSDAQINEIETTLDKIIKFSDGKLGGIGNAVSLPAKALKLYNNLNNKILWEYLHNSYKLMGYDFHCNLYKKLAKTDIIPKDVRQNIGQFTNDIFGGQIKGNLGITKKQMLWLQRTLLSPDWNISAAIREPLSIFSSAPTQRLLNMLASKGEAGRKIRSFCKKVGMASINNSVEGAKFRGRIGRRYNRNFIILIGASSSLWTLYNRLKDQADNPEYYPNGSSNSIPWDNNKFEYPNENIIEKANDIAFPDTFLGRNEKGREQYGRSGKQGREFPELIENGLYSAADKIASKSSAPIRPFATKASSSFARFSKDSKIRHKYGWKDKDGIVKGYINAYKPFVLNNGLKSIISQPADVAFGKKSIQHTNTYSAAHEAEQYLSNGDIDALNSTEFNHKIRMNNLKKDSVLIEAGKDLFKYYQNDSEAFSQIEANLRFAGLKKWQIERAKKRAIEENKK